MNITDIRASSYGPVGPNIERTAALWTAYLGTTVTAHDVGWLMALLKASRSKQDPANADNYLDAMGYINIAERLQ